MQKKEAAANLMNRLKKSVKLYDIWSWKEEFYALSDEFYEESPILSSAMAMLKVMEGRLDEAERYLDYTKSNAMVYAYTLLSMPTLQPAELLKILENIQTEHGLNLPNLTLSASRPTLLNGVKDFTKYGELIEQYKEKIIEFLEKIYGEAAKGAYEIALAEHLYQRNECFEALVLVVGTIPFMEHRKDIRCLFAALTLEMYILVVNGQAATTEPLVENLKKRVKQNELEELQPNIDALEAYASMYDDNMDKINYWMKEKAPDEYQDFNMLDTFRYMIKLRGYLIQGKHMALFALAERLKSLLKQANRQMDICELTLLMAMSCHIQERKEMAFDLLEEALQIAETYRYDRLVGDEGARMYQLLYEYRKERGSTPYLERVMDIARKMGILYPNYLKLQYKDIPKMSNMETRVLKLLGEEKSNAEIGEYLDITLNTVKFHTKNIFKKLSVKSRGQAVKKAKELEII